MQFLKAEHGAHIAARLIDVIEPLGPRPNHQLIRYTLSDGESRTAWIHHEEIFQHLEDIDHEDLYG